MLPLTPATRRLRHLSLLAYKIIPCGVEGSPPISKSSLRVTYIHNDPEMLRKHVNSL